VVAASPQIIKKGAAGAFGHTFGVRVQRVQKIQRVQRVADCPLGVKVLKMDRPYGPEGS